MPSLLLCAFGLVLVLSVGPIHAADYSYDFTPAEKDAWELRQVGAGRAELTAEGLRLDLTTPAVDKQAAAELRPALRLPLTVQWEQQLVRDSEHCYFAGATLTDGARHYIRAGLSGKPLGHKVALQGTTSTATITPGQWYRFTLRAESGGRVSLTVEDTAGQQLLQAGPQPTSLRGAFVHLGFFHNQAPAEGLDRYAQDRGSSAFRRLRLSTPKLIDGNLDTYRDAELRAGDRRTPPVFNRAMRWLGPKDGVEGTVVAYDEGAELPLTGDRQVSGWLPDRLCTMQPATDTVSVFTRPNDLDGYDRAVLRSLQWCVRQHPRLRYRLTPRAGRCYLRVCLIEPYLGDGIELFRTAEGTQPQQGEWDLGAALSARGLGYHQFGEIAVYVYQDRPAAGVATGQAELELSLTGPGALVTSAPVVAALARAREGLPIHAVVTGPEGRLLHGGEVKVSAEVGGRSVPLAEQGTQGVFMARLQGLTVGEHRVPLHAVLPSGQRLDNELCVSIVDAGFLTWQPGLATYQQNGRGVAPLLGDLYAWVPVLDGEQPGRRLILTADQWRQLSPAEQKRVGLIKERSLTEDEIRQQLADHRRNGMTVLRLAYNVSVQEAYLDAGGHVSPHGLETLAAVLRECRRQGQRVLLNVFHYPYGDNGTGSYPPWQSYVEAGYQGPQSFTTDQIWPLLTGYLDELLVCLRDDPGVVAYSLTGENDQTYGPEWINRLYRHMKSRDPNHLVTLEQGGGLQSCPGGNPWHDDVFEPRHSGGLGYRTYYSEKMKTDAYVMVCGRFYRCNTPAFLAEDASGPGWYPGFAATWTHPDFLTEVRDDSWGSVLCQQTMSLTWSAPWTQEERLVPYTCASLLDWSQLRRRLPMVAVVLKQADRPTVARLGEYEVALAKLGVDYDYLWEGRDDLEQARRQYAAILDARTAFTPPALPDAVLAARPVVPTGDYSVSYLLDDSGRQLVAYVRNTAEHKLGPGYGDGVNELHRQRTKPSALALTLHGFNEQLRYRVYDVDERRVVTEGACGGQTIDLGQTCHDYAVVVFGG